MDDGLEVECKINRINYGAFIIPTIWLLFHKQILKGIVLSLLLILIGQINEFIYIITILSIMFYYGLNGNRIAWEKMKYKSESDLIVKQCFWNVLGTLIFLFIEIPIIFALLISFIC